MNKQKKTPHLRYGETLVDHEISLVCPVRRPTQSRPGRLQRRQGELPRAADGLWVVVADGERDRTVYGIAMIR